MVDDTTIQDRTISTSQKVSGIVFIAGLFTFFYFGSEMLAKHTAWTDFKTPVGVGDIFGLFASVTASIGGALGVNVSKMLNYFGSK